MVERNGSLFRFSLIETVKSFPDVLDDKNADYKDPAKSTDRGKHGRAFSTLFDSLRNKKQELKKHMTMVSPDAFASYTSRLLRVTFL